MDLPVRQRPSLRVALRAAETEVKESLFRDDPSHRRDVVHERRVSQQSTGSPVLLAEPDSSHSCSCSELMQPAHGSRPLQHDPRGLRGGDEPRGRKPQVQRSRYGGGGRQMLLDAV